MNQRLRLHRDFLPKVRQLQHIAELDGIHLIIVSAYRSVARQKLLYDAWVARGMKGLPAAIPGSSFHNFGRAVDFATEAQTQWEQVGEIAESIGLYWGGRFNDPIHLDDRKTLTIDQAREAFREEDLVDLTS